MKSNRFAVSIKSNSFVTGAWFLTLVCFYACTKNATPPPPIHDTVTIHHTDTLRIPVVPDTPNMKNGLVLYLPFNGSFADSSGGGNTVTAIGGATLDYDMHGYAQSAFNSTGNGARLEISNNGFYKVDTAFTVSCDFMIRSNAFYTGGYDFSGLMVFQSIVNTSTGNGPTFDFGMTMPGLPQYFNFGVNSAQGADCSSSGAGNPYSISDTTHFTPQLESWYNVVCTFTKGTASVYINGQLVSTAKNSNTLSALFCPDAKFVVGGWWDGGNSGTENIRGKLDEVRLYNRTLNAREIAWLARNFQPASTRVAPSLKTN